MKHPSDHESSYTPLPYSLPTMSEAEQIQAAQRFLETMAHRRSVRTYDQQRPVPLALIEQAVRAAALAPSGANQQPWTFVVVGDPAIKREIRLAAEAEERENYERRMPEDWREALAPLGTDWHKPHLEEAPYLIVVFEQVYGLNYTASEVEERIKHYYVKESVGIAVGFLLAALTHAGLATLTHTPSPMSFLSRILERPTNERAYVLIPVGYPAPDATVPRITRKPLDEVLIKKL